MANDKLALSLSTHLFHDGYEFTDKRLSLVLRSDKDLLAEFVYVNLDIRERIVSARCDLFSKKLAANKSTKIELKGLEDDILKDAFGIGLLMLTNDYSEDAKSSL